MKTKTVVRIILFCICVFSGFQADAQEGDRKGKVFVELPRRITKGFPMILRISMYGPLTVPETSLSPDTDDVKRHFAHGPILVTVSETSLFDDTGDVRVHFKSNTDGTVWTIAPYRPRDLLLWPDGSIATEVSSIPQVDLAKGGQHAMLLDVTSLGSFDDIPPGEYSMTVEFLPSMDTPLPVVTSEPVSVQLVEPSAEEAKYLEAVRGLGLITMGKHGVNWSRVLRSRIPLPENDVPTLRAEAKGQMEFHVLLSRALRSEVNSREEARTFAVPEYLQLEKECLLLELDADKGRPEASVSQREFSDTHPELKWRFQNGARSFLGFRRTRGRSTGAATQGED